MKTRDLTKTLKDAEKGWVAINEENKVVMSAPSFDLLCKKVEKIKEELILLPSEKDYSGLITELNGK